MLVQPVAHCFDLGLAHAVDDGCRHLSWRCEHHRLRHEAVRLADQDVCQEASHHGAVFRRLELAREVQVRPLGGAGQGRRCAQLQRGSDVGLLSN